MSSSEYDELLNDLYAKVEAGEITEEEACKKMWSVDKIWMAPDIRIYQMIIYYQITILNTSHQFNYLLISNFTS